MCLFIKRKEVKLIPNRYERFISLDNVDSANFSTVILNVFDSLSFLTAHNVYEFP